MIKLETASMAGPLTICQASRHYINENGIAGWVISFCLTKGNVLCGKEHLLADTGEVLDYDTESGYRRR